MTDLRNASLPEDFTDSLDAWHKAVVSVFARVTKKDVADVPSDVWRKLIVTTNDGVDVSPLYTRADEDGAPMAEVPGAFPFTRGATVDTERAGWGVTETFGSHGDDPAEVNKQILHALNSGTTTISLDLTGSLAPEGLARALAGVYLNMVPVNVHAGTRATEAAEALYAIADEAGTAAVNLGASPLTSAVDGSESIDLDATIALARAASARDGVRAVLVDATSFSNQGASDAQEIGLALAAGVEYVRALVEAGLTTEQALGQIAFRFAATDDQFGQISKLRAARRLWARVAEVLGHADLGAAPQHAVTAPVMFSQRDPWVNMLRSTVSAFAAGVGGATDVEVLTFDSAIPGGIPGISRNFAHRIARNTNLLLLEESHLGHVIDPAGGSYYVESFTNDLSEKAWAIFADIEAAGGYRSELDNGAVGRAIDEMHEVTRDAIAKRSKQLTGINEFPNLAEAPLAAELRVEPAGVRRWAAEFEALRNRSDAFLEANGERPTIGLIPVGPLSRHNIRTGFTTNLLASGGIAVTNPGEVVPGTPEFEAAAKTDIVVICGTDQEYAATGEQVVGKLREAGVKQILLAGAPASFENAQHSPDGYLNMKIDAASTLATLLDGLGA
ncbi:Methylmalonyl-CoA mutase small subunit [Corynebacterium faecale]|uniref:methylmalonyl-CoA mutase family protein n=1 Tax=Corynebacterium faecale TaxID=1758466 RepID=UPI0025B4C8BB|nr:methylmalonyl-CoA mutase family protein [Corynebacterium faecale]WJY92295.1 Methylmalonyl-CoA mutase small subunit [Corynebacterium faecale]